MLFQMQGKHYDTNTWKMICFHRCQFEKTEEKAKNYQISIEKWKHVCQCRVSVKNIYMWLEIDIFFGEYFISRCQNWILDE